MTWSSLAKLVSTTTRVPGAPSRMRRMAAMPPPPGITRSMSTTSGRSRTASVTTASPSPASPTTSMPGRDSRNVRSPWRTTGWSSARNTRMPASSATGNLHPDGGAGAARTLDDDLPTEALGPLAHGREPEAPFPDGAGSGVEAHAVVVHGDRHRAAAGVDLDRDRLRLRVADGVVQRLLHDAVELDLPGGLGLGRALHAQFGAEVVGAAEDVEVLAYCGDEAVGLEVRGTQLEHERAELRLRLSGQLPDSFDLGLGARRITAHQPAGRLGRERKAEQVLCHRVVELAGEPVPLLDDTQLAAGLEEASVLDRDGGVGGEHADDLLVPLVERRRADFLGQVERADDVALGDDRDAEERSHPRVSVRPPAPEPRVGRDVVGAEGTRVGEHRPEHPVRAGEGTELGDEVVAHARVQELVELGALLVGDAERGVLGVDELTCRLHEPVEHGIESKLARDREHHVAHRREHVVARSVGHVVHPTSLD